MTRVFVFGSNQSGIHGAGAARYAFDHHGAIWKQGEGRQGDSYGIPTKDWNIKTLPLEDVAKYVNRFLEYAKEQTSTAFFITRIGCGLAGYTDAQIAPMFVGAPDNCFFPRAWEKWLGEVRYNDFT